MIRISIIIPIFNTGKYIRQCLDSLVAEMTPDVEILLIDDCSTDDGPSICQEYCDNHQEIHLIYQPQNMGVSAARNRGIEKAKGEYILFIDSDDFVASNYFETIDLLVTNKDADLFCFGHYDFIVSNSGNTQTRPSSMNINISSLEDECPWNKLFLSSFFSSPWNKLFLKSIIEKYEIRFDTNCVCYEDYLFNVEYCKHVNSFKTVDKPLYYYRQFTDINPVSKRNWGTRFAISEKVAKATNDFIKCKGTEDTLKDLRRYTYKAFLTELEASYHAKDCFNKDIAKLIHNEEFNEAVDAIVPCGRLLFLYKVARILHADLISKKILMKLIG